MAAGTRSEDAWHGTVGTPSAVAPRFRFLVGAAAPQSDAFTNTQYMKAANRPPYSLGEDVTINPTSTRRIVVIDVQTRIIDEALPNQQAVAGTEVVTCVQLIADDGMKVVAALFSGASEGELLRDFWSAVRPGDVFYGCKVIDRLALLRGRTWAWGLLPSREITLSAVYRQHAVDTAGLRTSTSDGGYRCAEALASVLGLPGGIQDATSALFRVAISTLPA